MSETISLVKESDPSDQQDIVTVFKNDSFSELSSAHDDGNMSSETNRVSFEDKDMIDLDFLDKPKDQLYSDEEIQDEVAKIEFVVNTATPKFDADAKMPPKIKNIKHGIFKYNEDSQFYECRICYKTLKERSLNQHYKVHLNMKSYKCSKCSSQFTRRGDLGRHVRLIHKPQNYLKCTICSETFTSTNNLKKHLERHKNKVFYSCSECDFKCLKEEFYTSHMRFIHPQKYKENDGSPFFIEPVKQLKRLMKSMEKKEEVPGNLSEAPVEHNELAPIVAEGESKKDSASTQTNTDKEPKENESFTQNIILDDKSIDKDDNELINKAIDVALCQAENLIENIQETSGCNFASDHEAELPAKLNPKYSILQITVSIGGNLQRFLIHVPSGSNIDATTQEGMDVIINMINFLCAGKGELDGPVEVVMQHKI